MARETIVTCDVCGKELDSRDGVIFLKYRKTYPFDPYTAGISGIENWFDFCCIEHMKAYAENVGFEKEAT